MDGIADKRGNYDINGIFDVNSPEKRVKWVITCLEYVI